MAFSGLPDVTIGNTLCSPSNIEPLPFVKINDPTVEMTFSVNDSPLAGREASMSPAARSVTVCRKSC